METRNCRKCGCLLTNENWSKSSQSGHSYICRECRNKYANDYNKKNPQRYRTSAQKYKEKFVEKFGLIEWNRHKAETNKIWRKQNPQNLKNSSKKYREKIILKVLTHYGGNPPKCACCGEVTIKFLTIDHINGGGRVHRGKIRGNRVYHWLIKNNFPEGFQVLCYNCNCGRARNGGICPHKVVN